MATKLSMEEANDPRNWTNPDNPAYQDGAYPETGAKFTPESNPLSKYPAQLVNNVKHYTDQNTGRTFYESAPGQYNVAGLVPALRDVQFDPTTGEYFKLDSTGAKTKYDPRTMEPYPTTPQGTAESSAADQYITTTEEYLKQIQEQDKQMADNAKALLESDIGATERSYGKTKTAAEEQYAEQEATKGVEQFRLGIAGTPYASAEKAKLSQKKMDYFGALQAEKDAKVSQLRQAYLASDYKRISELRDAVYKVNADQQKFLQDERKQRIEESKALIEQTKPTKVGNYTYQYNPSTGQYEIVSSEQDTTDQTSDVKNYLFYANEAKKSGKEPLDFDTWFSNQKAPASVKEFLIAQKNGFMGSMLEYEQQKKGVAAGMDADAIQYFAEKFLVDGKMPSFGYGAAGMGARIQFYNAVADIAATKGLTGQATAAQQAATKAATSALVKVQQLESTTKMAEQAAIKNAELAYQYGKSYVRPTDLKIVNKWKIWLGGQLSSAELTQFETALFTAAREYAKVASGAAGSIAGLTDSAMKEAERLLNSAMTQDQLRAAIDAMKADMVNVRGSMEEQRQYIEDQIAGGGGGNYNPNSTPTGAPAANADPDLDSIWK